MSFSRKEGHVVIWYLQINVRKQFSCVISWSHPALLWCSSQRYIWQPKQNTRRTTQSDELCHRIQSEAGGEDLCVFIYLFIYFQYSFSKKSLGLHVFCLNDSLEVAILSKNSQSSVRASHCKAGQYTFSTCLLSDDLQLSVCLCLPSFTGSNCTAL